MVPTTGAAKLCDADQKLVEDIVAAYISQQEGAKRLTTSLTLLFQSERLAPFVHSIRARAKDPEHLRDKLERKLRKSRNEGTPFLITPENFFEMINDLAGVRLLHLHTSQFQEINHLILELLGEEGYRIIEGPIARTWDDEYRKHFVDIGIETTKSERLYTSVHYVIEASARSKRTAELQVRTLAEELWGEVDHSLNYPYPCPIHACQEQIKVLARITSSCTRLVDSIFSSKADAEKRR